MRCSAFVGLLALAAVAVFRPQHLTWGRPSWPSQQHNSESVVHHGAIGLNSPTSEPGLPCPIGFIYGDKCACSDSGCNCYSDAPAQQQSCPATPHSHFVRDGSTGRFVCDEGFTQHEQRDCVPMMTCFPGEALLRTQRGEVPLLGVRQGDHVLVSRAGELLYEPVFAFLHQSNDDRSQSYVILSHERGIFRATASHLVFSATAEAADTWLDRPVTDIKIGDFVTHAEVGVAVSPSRVLKISSNTTRLGVFAPLTLSGTVVVDGVVASSYATAHDWKLKHSFIHAALFSLRVYHRLGLAHLLAPIFRDLAGAADQDTKQLTMHPVVKTLYMQAVALNSVVKRFM